MNEFSKGLNWCISLTRGVRTMGTSVCAHLRDRERREGSTSASD